MTADPTNTVIYELAVAARTDEKLRDTLREVMTAYIAKIYEAVASRSDSASEIRHCRRAESPWLCLAVLLSIPFNGDRDRFQHVLKQPEMDELADSIARYPFWRRARDRDVTPGFVYTLPIG